MAGRDSPPNRPSASPHNRRSSLTTATLSSIFRSNSVSSPSGTPAVPGPITSAALNDRNRRRLSISTATALGLSGTSPVSAGGNSSGAGAGSAGGIPSAGFAMRRASQSTASSVSDAIADESAIDDDDTPPTAARTAPNNTGSQARRVSFGAQGIRSNMRVPGSVSPGASTGVGNGRQNRPAQPSPAAFLSASRSPSQSSSSSIFPSGGRRPSLPTPPYPPSTSVRHASPRPVPTPPAAAPSPASASASQALPPDGHRAVTAMQSPRSPRIVSDNLFSPAVYADQGYNWSEQLRSRAESVASGSRASFSFGSATGSVGGMGSSPPRASGFLGSAGGGFGAGGGVGYHHGRAKSVSDGSAPAQVPVPPPAQQQSPAPPPPQPTRSKPDAFQERILKGDFYMD